MLTRLTPKFSIITVTRNAEDCLEETILSVITQTYHNIEYIIIDGKSTDRTMDIAGKYADRISHMVSEPDGGLYFAMNKGIALATGDYLCFLNAGDSFHEDDTLANIVHGLHGRHELPDIIYGETAIVDRQGHFVAMRRHKAPEQLTWRSFRQGMMVCHQAFIANRRIMEDYDTRYRFSADFAHRALPHHVPPLRIHHSECAARLVRNQARAETGEIKGYKLTFTWLGGTQAPTALRQTVSHWRPR